MTRLSDLNTENQYTAKVVSSHRFTPENLEEIKEIVLSVPGGDFKCDVDQSFGVLVKTSDEFGNHSHHRLYSVADVPEEKNGDFTLKMLVKRCSYIDDFSGERHAGIASNFLCNLRAGDKLTITGPFELPFKVPEDKTANMILIGMGTGIAPFRAFIKHIYNQVKDWEGKIRLFYGARSGLELLYLNDQDGDLTNYYDQETFKAFSSLSPRPHWNDPIALEQSMIDNALEIKELLDRSNTYVYVAGYQKINDKLNKAMVSILGSEEKWQTRKSELIAGKKWAEILY